MYFFAIFHLKSFSNFTVHALVKQIVYRRNKNASATHLDGDSDRISVYSLINVDARCDRAFFYPEKCTC